MEKEDLEVQMCECKYHEWWVYSTAVGNGIILVECNFCGALGFISEYTDEEWSEAFYAPSDPYRWEDETRVVICEQTNKTGIVI